MKSKVRKDLLTMLADHLETLNGFIAERFEMSTWYRGKVDRDQTICEAVACGTHACAAGFGAMMPAFKRLGFQLNALGRPEYKGVAGLYACEKFFGLTPRQATRLFMNGEFPRTLAEEVKIIRTFVARAR